MNRLEMNTMVRLLEDAGMLLRYRDEAAAEEVFSTADANIFCKLEPATGSFKFTNDKTGEVLAQGKGVDMFRVILQTLVNPPKVELTCPVAMPFVMELFRQGQFKPFSKADEAAYAGCDGTGFIYSDHANDYEIIADVVGDAITFSVMMSTGTVDTACWTSTINFNAFERIV